MMMEMVRTGGWVLSWSHLQEFVLGFVQQCIVPNNSCVGLLVAWEAFLPSLLGDISFSVYKWV